MPPRAPKATKKRKSPATKAKEEKLPIRILQPFAAQLQRLRLEQDLVQEVVAERAGITHQHLGLIEGALVNPGTVTVIGLAGALGVTVGKLFETTPGEGSLKELPPLPRKRATRRPKPY